ncbi:MAG: hypothetical protein KF864_00765 [Phycisphaeraceae bacterium]|nr:hypothetical protein [Phycisphaeraceae bacterium]
MKKRSISVVLSAFTAFCAGQVMADCPAAGSGAAGVSAWEAANCGEDSCATLATTCNGEFTIELLDFAGVDGLVTFTYEVCKVGGGANLSHWSIGMAGIGCLASGIDDSGMPYAYTLHDLVVGATLNGSPVSFEIGMDPTTQVYGLKFDEEMTDPCAIFTITLDSSKVDPLFQIAAGCTVAATKAGSQDIRSSNRPSPGYACIAGPVCKLRPQEDCPADFNEDGGIDGADVEAFFDAWMNGDESADVNHDGGVDGADMEVFFAAWKAGGCF